VTTLARLPFTLALIVMLEEATGRRVGNGAVPRVEKTVAGRTEMEPLDTQDKENFPYYILYKIGGTTYDGPPFGAEANADVWWTYQVTPVALREDQQQSAEDRIVDAVLGRTGDDWTYTIDVDGMSVMTREARGDGGGDSGDGIVTSAPRFAFAVTPA
jgi:hypothetical protein